MEGDMDEEDDDMPIFGDNVRELAQKGGGGYPLGADDLSDDEREDYYIKDTDALIVVGKIVFFD
jgi:periodic tryptophan protein 1